MTKVADVMSRNIPHVDYSANVLNAVKTMNEAGATGVVVLQGKRVVGMLTERALLRRFVPMDKRPDEVKVGDVMAPLLKIGGDASIREAANKIVQNRVTRLGVFDDGEFIGWLTISDLARERTRKSLLETLLFRGDLETDETLCPVCRNGTLERVMRKGGKILRWECATCGHVE